MKYYQIKYTDENYENCFVNFLKLENAIKWGCKNLFNKVGGEKYHYYNHPIAKVLTDVKYNENHWFSYKYLDTENKEWELRIGSLWEREINFEDENNTYLMTTITKYLRNNKKFLNKDNYLSFEDVKSIEIVSLTDQHHYWVDGVQLDKKENVLVWVSTTNSKDIFSITLKELSEEQRITLLERICLAISHKDIKI